MDIFQRSIHSNVKQLDDDHFLVTSQLLDLEHSFHLELRVRISTGEIESVNAAISKTPFARCLKAVDGVDKLVGLRIERGILGKVNAALGGPRGCTHLVELIQDSIRLIAMLRIGKETRYWERGNRGRTDEEIIAESRETLRNSCLIFSDE